MICVLNVPLPVVTARLLFASFSTSTLFHRGCEGAVLLKSLTGVTTLTWVKLPIRSKLALVSEARWNEVPEKMLGWNVLRWMASIPLAVRF
jgi:hypothetical protein